MSRIIKVAMMVVDAHEVYRHTGSAKTGKSPRLHNAVHIVLDALKNRDDIEIEIVYGRTHPDESEFRKDGCLHYVPVPYKPVPVPGIGGPYLGRTLALLRYIKHSSPDIVHAQGTERESGLVAALSGRPSILTLHGNLTELARTMNAKPLSYFGLASRIERYALGKVSGVHCISTHTQTSVKARAKRTWIIPNAVALDYFEINGNQNNSPNVVCMSGISEWKNPMALVQSSDLLHTEFPECVVHFYGEYDPNHPYGRRFLDAIATRPWCIAHGNASSLDIREALSHATCTVLPSFMDNCPSAVLESMAAAVPVIGSRVGGIPDLITHGYDGYLFDPEDTEQLAEYLVQIHRDPDSRRHMGDMARQSMRERHTPDRIAADLVRMYRDIISESDHI